MKKIIIFCILFFCCNAYAEDLTELAESVFDVDYIDFQEVYVMGSRQSGMVLVAKLKNGNVLTKTLKKSPQYQHTEEVSAYIRDDHHKFPSEEKQDLGNFLDEIRDKYKDFTFEQIISELDSIASVEQLDYSINSSVSREEWSQSKLFYKLRDMDLTVSQIPIATNTCLSVIKTFLELMTGKNAEFLKYDIDAILWMVKNTESAEVVKAFKKEHFK